MIWLRFAPLVLSGSLGLFAGWVLSGYWNAPVKLENASLRADKKLMDQASSYTHQLHERSAAQARRSIDMLLARLDRARAGRETRYEYRDRIIERLPTDRVCFDDDDLRVLNAADDAAGIGLADSIDPGRLVDRAATDPSANAGVSVRAAGEWASAVKQQHNNAREQIGVIGGLLRSLDGVCGCVQIENENNVEP